MKPSGALDAAALYKLMSWGGVEDPAAPFVWENHAPSKVRFFAWLLVKARVLSRHALLQRCVLTVEEAGCPICSAPLETANHIFLECPFARRFWRKIGFVFPADADVRRLPEYGAPAAVPRDTTSTFFLLCLWNLWKHRNAVVFREETPCLPRLIAMCCEDAHLWRARLPQTLKTAADAWLVCLREGEL